MSQQNKVSYAVIPGIRISEKNLLPVFDLIVPSGNGIAYERNGDGSVHVYGTAADSSYCEIVNSGKKFILPAGTYTMSMGNATYPAGITISANAYNQDFSYNKYYGDIGSWASQCTFEAVEGTYFSLNITINAGTTIDITLYPQLEAGSVATEYEPYEIIEGFTRKIKKKYLVIDGVTRKLTKKYSCVPKLVGYSEKNLLPKSKINSTTQGITFELRSDGSVYAHGTATGVAYCNFVHISDPIPLPAGEYNISPGTNLSVGYIAIARADDRTILATSSTKVSGTNTRFTLTEETQIYAYLRFPTGAVVDAVVYPQLERGSVATEYEPYEIWKSFTRLVYSATEDISAAEITLASGTLTYNGNSQTKKVSSVVLNGKTLVEGTDYTVSGNTGTNAGSYTMVIRGIGDYEGEAYAEFSIAKATGKISVSPTSLSIAGVKGTTKTATISYTGDGSISVKSGSTVVATVTRSGNTVTVKSVATGTATITITLAAGTNYTGANCTISVSSTVVSATLDSNTWATIKSVAADGANYWSVGDRKGATINGMVGARLFSNETWYAYIIGFNHNESIEGKGIHFSFGFKSANSTTNYGFVDSYINTYQSGVDCFNMSKKKGNSGGWAATDMYNSICPAFLSALASSLQNAIAACTKYTDNTGYGSGTSADVTATSSKIWLMAEFEICGKRTNANTAEKNYQKQYAYYANGNSKIKYYDRDVSGYIRENGLNWFTRSPTLNASNSFSGIDYDGNVADYNSDYVAGFVPCFKIA